MHKEKKEKKLPATYPAATHFSRLFPVIHAEEETPGNYSSDVTFGVLTISNEVTGTVKYAPKSESCRDKQKPMPNMYRVYLRKKVIREERVALCFYNKLIIRQKPRSFSGKRDFCNYSA